jgi:hypothetical protein
MKLEIFVVFHKNLYPENYADLTTEEFACLTFVAVNPKIAKNYPKYYKVINEWEFPIYDPKLQETNYKENSAILHIFQNSMITTDFVGFAQYDMRFNANSIATILREITPTDGYGLLLAQPKFAFVDTVATYDVTTIKRILTFPNHKDGVIPLLNTYVIHADMYRKMVEFMIATKDSPKFLEKGSNPAGVFERVTGYALSQLIRSWHQLNMTDLNHIQKKENY